MQEKLYRINEIFYSLQGEGRWAGRAAVFIRFSGCNLKCPFCDTNFKEYTEMTLSEILAAITDYRSCGFVVLTGGEPTLQLDQALVDGLRSDGFFVAVESNGTRPLEAYVDWLTISPKTAYVDNGQTVVQSCSELKVVYDGEHEPSIYGIMADNLYIQPCDVGDEEKNAEIVAACVEFIKEHPQWKLSLQQQKIINVR
ncbi:MAG: radical SAM protein [Prevotella sp.]|nr:radical SAM protein [Prevotella sp.]